MGMGVEEAIVMDFVVQMGSCKNFYLKSKEVSQAWESMHIIPALGIWRLKELEDNLSYITLSACVEQDLVLISHEESELIIAKAVSDRI